MLSLDSTVLVVIDVQLKLFRLMHQKEELFENLKKLISCAKVLGIPIIWVEQNPKGLGPTIPEIASILSPLKPIEKLSFSCCGSEEFIKKLKLFNRKQVLLAGIETHVCVYQTAADLSKQGYEVEVVADAVSSRSKVNVDIAFKKVCNIGCGLSCTEMAIFELLGIAKGEKFKKIIKIVK